MHTGMAFCSVARPRVYAVTFKALLRVRPPAQDRDSRLIVTKNLASRHLSNNTSLRSSTLTQLFTTHNRIRFSRHALTHARYLSVSNFSPSRMIATRSLTCQPSVFNSLQDPFLILAQPIQFHGVMWSQNVYTFAF